MAKSADAHDSKSCGENPLRVQVPPRALICRLGSFPYKNRWRLVVPERQVLKIRALFLNLVDKNFPKFLPENSKKGNYKD